VKNNYELNQQQQQQQHWREQQGRDPEDTGAAGPVDDDEIRDGAYESDAGATSTKKTVRWRDQQRQKHHEQHPQQQQQQQQGRHERTDIENKVADLASKYCGGVFHQGEDIADVLSSPTGRTAQTFFGGGAKTPGSMANMASSLFGGADNSNSNTGGSPQTQTKVFYDDLGNPIREDDMSQAGEDSVQQPSYPTAVTTAQTAPLGTTASPSVAGASAGTEQHKNGRQNLFCSNIPFIDTVMTGIGIAGVIAASAAVKAGVPENYCGVYTKQQQQEHQEQQRRSEAQNEISEELRLAQESLGVFEPESYDPPIVSSGSKLQRQSTPRNPRRKGQNLDPEDDLTVDDDDNDDDDDVDSDLLDDLLGGNEAQGSSLSLHKSHQSYAKSDITMGNTTIKHFRASASENASLFDDMEDDTSGSVRHSPGKLSKNVFSSMVEELKEVQEARKGQHGHNNNTRRKNKKDTDAIGVSISSIKHNYEKSCKSPRHSVVTSSYRNSLKKSPINSRVAGKFYGVAGSGASQLPATPNHKRNNNTEVFERRTGKVANLARQFDSPRSNYRASPGRKCVDPLESRFFDGSVDLLPPTPRRKSPETPTGYSMSGNKLEVQDWGIDNNAPTPSSRYNSNKNNNYNAAAREMISPHSAYTYNTDAEVREAPSTILDMTSKQNRPKFAGRRPRSLVTGPETVKDEDESEEEIVTNNNDEELVVREDRRKSSSNNSSKRSKSKERRNSSKSKERTSFANKLKKSMGKALNPVKKATRKGVESTRILDGGSSF